MTARLVAIHKMPKDPERYRSYYMGVHLPLALKLPGLRKYELNKDDVGVGHEGSDVLLVAVLHFDSLEAIHSALASPAGEAAVADVPKFSEPGDVKILTFEMAEYSPA